MKLAIIIPYYKIPFFDNLLRALCDQTDKRFNVYIGDDSSPDNITSVLSKYNDKLNIAYHRFTDRLGNISLTGQWERCLQLIGDEEWVWFIPDDDLPSPNCVEEFYLGLEQDAESNVNVFTIPVRVIDARGATLRDEIPQPLLQNNYDFYMNQLSGKYSGSSLGDNIFRKQALIECGGFVDFPKAWGSDHATILRASAGKKILCLQNTYLGFRQSGINISSQTDDGDEKMHARVLFAQWLKDNESIFPEKPASEFYRYFYWKGEYYALHEWKFSLRLFYLLLKLRRECIGSLNPLPLFLLFARKISHTHRCY